MRCLKTTRGLCLEVPSSGCPDVDRGVQRYLGNEVSRSTLYMYLEEAIYNYIIIIYRVDVSEIFELNVPGGTCIS